MFHITQQRSPAAATEPGRGTDHHKPAAPPQPLHCLDTLPHTRPPSLGCDKLAKERDQCPSGQHRTLPRSLSEGTFHCCHSATVPFPICRLYAAALCIKIQHCPTTPAQRAVSSTDEADACLSNLSPSSWIPTGSHSELV